MDVKELYKTTYGCEPAGVERLPGAGSSRKYFRIAHAAGGTIIGTEGENAVENRAFLRIAAALLDKGLPVPAILAAAPDYGCYLQEDLGDTALFDAIATGRKTGVFSPDEHGLLKDAVALLANVQIAGGKDFDYSVCEPYNEMDADMVDWDLNYFKYCFLKPVLGDVDDRSLQDEFNQIRRSILDGNGDWNSFMIRDFQSRNIMVTPTGLRLIDFQGGRRGPMAYDLASFLWQAKANIPQALRDELADHYVKEANRLGASLDPAGFKERMKVFALFRILQTLGAYGFRGLIQGKQHFIESIPNGVANLKAVLATLPFALPCLSAYADTLSVRFQPQEPLPGLTVTIGSFSYKKGYPADPSGNGGGFVFDCRAIHNPGRYEQYKALTGRDEAVGRFLEDDGEALAFLSHAEALVGASVERYLRRGFTSLSVWFGCTGGQHRSVYCAEAMARFVNERYGARVSLIHREQNIRETLSPKKQ
ncbi:MAG: phosphotransferase [Muribaculaceae bacterium]|nr:phosphotransferase [Muribaculaceae bacterium]